MPRPILENSLFKDPFKAKADGAGGGGGGGGAEIKGAAAAAECETEERHRFSITALMTWPQFDPRCQ